MTIPQRVILASVGGTALGIVGALALWFATRERRPALTSGREPFGRARVMGKTATEAGTLTYHRGRLPLEERIRMIQGHVAKGVQDPRMRKLALSITRNCPARDDACEAEAIHEWIAHNVRYTGDVGSVILEDGRAPEPVDLYQSPQRTLEFGGGDCDDQSALAATLLAQNGITPKLAVVSNTGATWDHIFACAMLPKDNPRSCVPVDTTLGPGQFGRRPRYKDARVFPA